MTAAATGTATASAGRPLPISAPASSAMVPPGSSTPGRAAISAMTSPHSTATAAAVGRAFSACGTAAAPAMTLIAPQTNSYYVRVEAEVQRPENGTGGNGRSRA